MAYSSDFTEQLKSNKKKKKTEYQSEFVEQLKSGTYKSALNDIKVETTPTTTKTTTTPKKEESSWLKQLFTINDTYFKDGYQFGDMFKTALDTNGKALKMVGAEKVGNTLQQTAKGIDDDPVNFAKTLAYGTTEGIGQMGTTISENIPYTLSNKVATKKDIEDYETKNKITSEKKKEIIDNYIKEYGDIDTATTELANLHVNKKDTLDNLKFAKYDKVASMISKEYVEAKKQNPKLTLEEYKAQVEKELADIEYARDILQEQRGRKPFTDSASESLKAGLDLLGIGEFVNDFKEELKTPFDQVREWGQKTFGEGAQEFQEKHEFVGGITQSIGQLLPTIATVAITKNPTAGTAIFATSAKGGYYEDYIARGYTTKEAEAASNFMTTVEVGSEFIGGALGGVNILKKGALKEFAKQPLVQTIKGFGVEGVEELIAEAASIGTDINLGEDVTLEEAGERAWTAFASGVVLGAVMKGAGVAGSKAQNIAERINRGEQVTEAEVTEALEEVAEQNDTTVEALLEEETNTIMQTTQEQSDQIIKEYEQKSTDVVEELNQKADEVLNKQEVEKNEAPQDEISDVSEQSQQVIFPEVETAQNKVTEPNTAIEENIPIETAQNVSESQINEENVAESDLKRQKFIYQAQETDSDIKKSVYESASVVMNNTEAAHKFADAVAKIAEEKNTSYKFTNSKQLSDMGYKVKKGTINGLVTENGEVLINIDSAKALNTVLGHETTHLLEGTEEYDALKKIAVKFAKTNGDYQSRIDNLESLYEGKNADIEAELTADIVGDYLFTNEQFIQELSVQKPTIFQKIKNLISDLVVKFKGTAQEKQLRELQRKFEKAYKTQTEQTNTGTKYSLSEDGKIVDTSTNEEVKLETSEAGTHGTLMAIHNLNEGKLKGVIELGGFPLPSIAITQNVQEGYGDISVLFDKSTIDPANKKNEVYDRDVWSPRVPRTINKFASKIDNVANNLGLKSYQLKEYLEGNTIEAATERLSREDVVIDKFLEDNNIQVEQVESIYKNKEPKAAYHKIDEIQNFVKENDVSYQKLMEDTNLRENYLGALKNWAREKYKNSPFKSKLVDGLPPYIVSLEEQINNDVTNGYYEGDLYVQSLNEDFNNIKNAEQEIDEYETKKAQQKAKNLKVEEYKPQFESYIREQLETINEGKYFEKEGIDPYTDNGRKSFSQLHTKYTLENLVKAMKSKSTIAGESLGTPGFGEIQASMAKKFKSIEDIKSSEKQIIPREQEGKIREAASDTIWKDLFELSKGYKYYNPNADGFDYNNQNAIDNASQSLFDLANSKKITVENFKSILNENLIDANKIPTKTLQKAIANLIELRNLPTEYFEAKPQRAVGLDEVQAIVIPNTISTGFKQQLQNAGLKYYEYDPNIEGDRQRVISQFDDLKFSLSAENEDIAPIGDYNVYGEDVKLQEDIAPVQEENIQTTPTVEEIDNIIKLKEEGGQKYAKAYYEAVDKYGHTEFYKALNEGYKRAKNGTQTEDIAPIVEETIAPLQETISELTEQVKKLSDQVENAALNNPSLAETAADNALEQQVEANNEPTEIVEDTTPDYDSLLNEMLEVHNENRGTETTSETRNDSELQSRNAENARAVQEKVSREINEYKTEVEDYVKEKITTNLGLDKKATKDIIDKISNKERVTEQDIYEAFEGHREIKLPLDKSIEAEYKAIKDYFKGRKLNVGSYNKADINAGEFNKFRRQYFGKTNFVLTGGENVDTAYMEMSDAYPHLFPDDITNPADQTMQIAKILDEVYNPTVETIELTDTDIADIAGTILDGYNMLNTHREALTNKYLEELNKQADLTSLEENILIVEPQNENTDTLVEEATPDIPIAENAVETVQEDAETTINNIHDTVIGEPKAETAIPEVTTPKVETESTTPKLPTNTAFDNMVDTTIANATRNIATVEASGYGTNRTEKAKKTFKEKVRNAVNTFQDLMVNRSRAVDQYAKQVGNLEIKYKNDRLNNVMAEISGEINLAQTDLYGNKIGEAMITPFNAADEVGLREDFNYYLTHVANIERSAREKGLGGIDGVTSAEIVKAYEEAHPEFIQWKNQVVTYNRNALNNDVTAGLVDKGLATQLTSMYPNYMPFHFDKEVNFALSPDEIKAGKTIKTAEGGGDITKMFTIEEAMVKQTISRKIAQVKNDLLTEIVKSSPTVAEFELGDIQASELGETVFTDASGTKYATAYIDGKSKTVEISDDLYNAFNNELDTKIKELEEKFELITKPLQAATTVFGKMNTTWSLTFPITNFVKDMFDAPLNSKHTTRWLGNSLSGRALYKMKTNDATWQQFKSLYGTDTLQQEYGGSGKTEGIGKNLKFLNKIGGLNQFIEMYPRYSEFLSSLEAGDSLTQALYNAREVSTNFGRGGTISKAINRNGVAFFNVSIQGFDKLRRNFSGENGAMGIVKSLAKVTALGMLPAIFNHLLFGDDEEYEELSDYVKDNYYLIKMGDGTFFRIPKGRMLSVFGSAARRTLEMAEGEENAFDGYLTNAWTQVGFSNPVTDNIFSGIIDVANNETWYGTDLVPTRLQDMPNAEQYDESTDEFSKWLGEQIDYSPYKINYLLNQYGGSAADIVLPMITDEAKTDKEGFLGTVGSLFTSKFTANSTFNNKYVSDFYSIKEELEKLSNSSKATEEDILQSKYLNSISSDLSELYKEKREIQSRDYMSNAQKYKRVESIQREIDDISKEALEQYKNIDKANNYAVIGDREYYKKEGDILKGEEDTWTKVSDKDLETVNSNGLTTSEKGTYFSTKTKLNKLENKDEKEDYLYNSSIDTDLKTIIYENTVLTSFEKEDTNKIYKAAKAAGIDIDNWLAFEKQTFKADKNKYGESIDGTKKKKVYKHINSLELSIPQKAIMFKLQYPKDKDYVGNSYNYDIVSYVSELDTTYDEKVSILEGIGMEVDSKGNIYW